MSAERAYDLVTSLEVDDPAGLMRVELALDHIEDIRRFDLRIDEATLKIHAAVKESGTTLTRIYGVGPLNAGLILGEVGDVSRFPTRDHFASYTGTAPVAVSSGDVNRHRLNRAGNRQLNRPTRPATTKRSRGPRRARLPASELGQSKGPPATAAASPLHWAVSTNG